MAFLFTPRIPCVPTPSTGNAVAVGASAALRQPKTEDYGEVQDFCYAGVKEIRATEGFAAIRK